jgi:DNA-directed RNA polymerase subunit beta
VLIKELQSLCLDVKVLSDDKQEISIKEDIEDDFEEIEATMEGRDSIPVPSMPDFEEYEETDEIMDDAEDEVLSIEELDSIEVEGIEVDGIEVEGNMDEDLDGDLFGYEDMDDQE